MSEQACESVSQGVASGFTPVAGVARDRCGNPLATRLAKVLIGVVITTLGVVGVTGPGVATASPRAAIPRASLSQASCGDTTDFDTAALSSLPPEATDTVTLIQQGGPFPYPRDDGGVFGNREGILPACASSYYHEYTVITPGSPNRGARRIVTGSAGEYFYTDDHYASFVLMDINS